MKILNKNTILLSALMGPGLAFAQRGEYKLSVSLKKTTPEAKVYVLLNPGRSSDMKLDSAILSNGKAQFSYLLDEPTKARLIVTRDPGEKLIAGIGKDFLELYLEKGTSSIIGQDSVITAKINAGPVTADYLKYNGDLQRKVKTHVDSLRQLISFTPKAQQDAAFSKSIEKGYGKLIEIRKSAALAYIKAHPDKYLSLDLVRQMSADKFENTANADRFKSLSATVKNTPSGKKIMKSIDVITPFSEGKTAPDFTQNDVNDKPVKLSDFRGKYVLLDFWASWCLPCRAENPTVVKAYENYKSKNFTVLGVSLDNPGKKQAWLDAIEKDGLP